VDILPTIAEHTPPTSPQSNRGRNRAAVVFTETDRDTQRRALTRFGRGVVYMTQHRVRGHDYFGPNDLDRAIAEFTKAIELGLRNALLYAHRGTCHQINGNLRHALADFSRAIDIAPEERAAYRLRARAYTQWGEPAKAEADLATARHLDTMSLPA
jgi:tetratricopeptide (TPR) repeat protein